MSTSTISEPRPLWQKRRFLLPVTAVLAFMLGSSGDDSTAAPTDAYSEVQELRVQLDDAEDRAERAEADARLAQGWAAAADQARQRAEDELALAQRPAEPPPAPELAPEPPPSPEPVQPASAPAAKPQSDDDSGCNPNYTPCVPAGAGDLDCADIGHPVRVVGSDPHDLDREGDGVGCESYG